MREASLNFFHFRNKYRTPKTFERWCIRERFLKYFLEPLRAPAAINNSYLIGEKSLTSYSPDCRTSVSRASFPVQGRSARPTGSFRSCASARNARPLDDGRLSFAVEEKQRLTERRIVGESDQEKRKGGKMYCGMARREESRTVSIGRSTSKKNNSTIVRAVACFSFSFFFFFLSLRGGVQSRSLNDQRSRRTTRGSASPRRSHGGKF